MVSRTSSSPALIDHVVGHPGPCFRKAPSPAVGIVSPEGEQSVLAPCKLPLELGNPVLKVVNVFLSKRIRPVHRESSLRPICR